MVRDGKALILSMSAGAGHMRAAQALKSAMEANAPAFSARVVDTFLYVSPFLQKAALGVYLEMIRHTPKVYGYIYRQLENGQFSGRTKLEFNRVLNRITAPKLQRLIAEEKPDVLVCTHPFPLGVLDYLKRRARLDRPVVAALTDFTVHPFWVFPTVDLYLVGDEGLAFELDRQGIADGRTVAAGIPINPCFASLPEKVEARKRLNLAQDVPTALVMGGGLGMGPLEEVVKRLGNLCLPLQLLVVAGNNGPLKVRLKKLLPLLSHPARIFGFVDEIHNLMACADFMVGKAGGLSCAEALASGLPIFIIDPIPGQEERNTEFLVRRGAACLAKEPEELARQVQDALNSGRLGEMTASALSLGRPLAAAEGTAAIAALAKKTGSSKLESGAWQRP